MMSALFRQKISKDGQILGKFQKFIKNYSDIIYEWLLPFLQVWRIFFETKKYFESKKVFQSDDVIKNV